MREKYGQVHGVYISIYGNNIRSLRSRGYPFTKPTNFGKYKTEESTNKTVKCIIVMWTEQ